MMLPEAARLYIRMTCFPGLIPTLRASWSNTVCSPRWRTQLHFFRPGRHPFPISLVGPRGLMAQTEAAPRRTVVG